MTIRIAIKNEEAAGGRTLKVSIGRTPRDGHRTEQWAANIAPQEQQEFHAHMAQHIIVEELEP